MPRPSPQTDRVVAVIELLSSTERGATMTEIARALEVNQASCVHLLAALVTAGFVVREPADRRYHLGPALVRPGRLAADRYPVLAAARDEMLDLSARFALPCFAFAPEVDHARLVHYTWPPGGPAPAMRMGETVPLTPPLGIVFVTWGPDLDFDRWLAMATDAGPDQIDRLREQREAIRELGFVVELAAPPTQQADLAQVIDDRPSPYRDGQLHRLLAAGAGEDYLLTDFEDGRLHAVSGIGAPVFDEREVAVLSFNLIAFDHPLPSADITEVGLAVREATDRVTKALGGVPPAARR